MPQGLLACLFDSNCNSNSHTNHGVVTCADETHHLCAVDALGGYMLTAKIVDSYIDYIIRKNSDDFRRVAFIGK